MLALSQMLDNEERDIGDNYLLSIGNTSPIADSDESQRTSTDFLYISTPSSRFTFSPATWTPQELGHITALIPSLFPYFQSKVSFDNEEMTDNIPIFFTGKSEDQDPQDFMNRIEQTILMRLALAETDKVRYLAMLTRTDKASFKAMRVTFELWWPPKPITEKTMAEKQALLEETILKPSDLGKRTAASIGGEEELLHVVWADKVEKLTGDIPDTTLLRPLTKNFQRHS